MDDFAHVMGWIVLAIGTFSLGLALLSFLADRLTHLCAWIEARGAENERRAIAIELRSTAWWFSEHKPTTDLLLDVSEYVGTSSRDTSDLRAKWKERSKHEPTYSEVVADCRTLIAAIDDYRFSPNVMAAETDEKRALVDQLFTIGQKRLQWYDGTKAKAGGVQGAKAQA